MTIKVIAPAKAVNPAAEDIGCVAFICNVAVASRTSAKK